MNESKLADLLMDLVAARSVNPADRKDIGRGFDEQPVLALLEKELDRLRIDHCRQDVSGPHQNLVAVIEGKVKGPALVLSAHTDVVAAEDWEASAFVPRRKGDRIYGRGACDCKANLAAMIAALESLVARGRPEKSIAFVATCDEEHGFSGSRRFTESMPLAFPPAGIIAGEPTGLEPVIAHKAVYRWRITVSGRSAHAAVPRAGVSAITRMGKLTVALDRYATEKLSQQTRESQHPLLDPPTLTVSQIRGGSAINIVPAQCVIGIDARLLPGRNPTEMLAKLDSWLSSGGRIDFDYAHESPTLDAPGLNLSPESPLARQALAACRQFNPNADFQGVSYATDAGIFASAGLDALVLGPGRIDTNHCHARDEFIDLPDLTRAAELFSTLLNAETRTFNPDAA